jgi:hypothetical protein
MEILTFKTLGWMAWVRFPAVQNSSLLHCVQIGSGAHSASYPTGTRGSFPGGKAAGAYHSATLGAKVKGQEQGQLYLVLHVSLCQPSSSASGTHPTC